jgi:hypothetical protein
MDRCAACGAEGLMIWGEAALVCTACGAEDKGSMAFDDGGCERSEHATTVPVDESDWRLRGTSTSIERHARVPKLMRELHAQSDEHAALRSSIQRDASILAHVARLDMCDDSTVCNDGQTRAHAAIEEARELAQRFKLERWDSGRQAGGERSKAVSQRGRQRQVTLLLCYVEGHSRHGRRISRSHALQLLSRMEHFEDSTPEELARYLNAAERAMDAFFGTQAGGALHEIGRAARAVSLELARRDRYQIASRAVDLARCMEQLGDAAQLFLQAHSMNAIAGALMMRAASHLQLTAREVSRVAARAHMRVTEKTLTVTHAQLCALLDTQSCAPREEAPPTSQDVDMQRLQAMLLGQVHVEPKVVLEVVDA